MSIVTSGAVETEKDGDIHKATYTVWKEVVTVEYEGRSKSTQLGNSSAESIAKWLLIELVNQV